MDGKADGIATKPISRGWRSPQDGEMDDCSSFQIIDYIFDLHPISEEGSPWRE